MKIRNAVEEEASNPHVKVSSFYFRRISDLRIYASFLTKFGSNSVLYIKIVVRIKPTKEYCWKVKKVSNDSYSVRDRQFTFDSVLDSNLNQVRLYLSHKHYLEKGVSFSFIVFI